jgi:hypothetical protein
MLLSLWVVESISYFLLAIISKLAQESSLTNTGDAIHTWYSAGGDSFQFSQHCERAGSAQKLLQVR